MSAGEETTTTTTTTNAPSAKVPFWNLGDAVKAVTSSFTRSDLPRVNVGDTVRVHAKIIEGTKERIQIFEGVVLKRVGKNNPDATFTVRKESYNIGVERTFPLHSPRIDKIEVVSRARVRRARLFYLRPLRGKATRMKTLFQKAETTGTDTTAA